MLISLLTEKNKHEQFKFFKKFKAIYEKQHETKIKELRSDNGLEYFSSEFQEFLRREGIVHKTQILSSIPDKPNNAREGEECV